MKTRRDFFKTSLMALGSLLLAIPQPVWAKKMAFRLGQAKKLQKPGGWTILKLKGKSILFVRESESSIRALSSICTHKQCSLAYHPERKRIECSCHRSAFDLDGTVLSGPAPKSLPTFSAVLKGDRVIVSLD